MKKNLNILIFVFLLLLSFNVSGQNSTPKKTDNQTITVKLEKENTTSFDKYYKYFTDILGPLIALIGILLTLPILKKKLLENHISKALIDIQDANKNLLTETTDLIDEYIPKTFSNDRVLKDELQEVLDKIKLIYKTSQKGNSDSQTMLFFLKYAIQNTIKHYDPKKYTILSSREIYGLVLFTLEQVVFFSTQVVQIPKSTKTNNENLINKKIKKYVSNSEFLKYKHFKQGLIDDPNSAHYLLFYNQINHCSSTLLKRATFQIFWNISAIKKILFISKIYAPLEINAPNISPLFGGENHRLYLIGFKKSTSLLMKEGTTKKVVDLIYSNPDDFGRFASNLTFKHLKENYKDVFINNSNFSFERANSMTQQDLETFSIQYELEYLESLFKKNKKEFKTKLK